MAMIIKSLFTKLISLFLLLHLGCFTSPSNSHHRRRRPPPQKASSSSSSKFKVKTHKALSASWSFLKRVLTRQPVHSQTHPESSAQSTYSAKSSIVNLIPPDAVVSDPPRKRPIGSHPASDISVDQHFVPLRNDIYPCPVCGEIFQRPNLLEHHQSIKHAVSELHDGDSGSNIIRIIFQTGWPEKAKTPNIHRILKIHSSPQTLASFEEYREAVKLRASRSNGRRRDERCIADGNELLRFHCATFMCDLGRDGGSSLCDQQYCGVCGIVRSGFSPKMDGISTAPTSWRGHVAVPEEVEEEFGFMNVKRAMLVCRVIAGRVGCEVGKEDPGFDSVAGRGDEVVGEDDELLVFNPTAVLPCFAIVYTV